MAGTRLEISDAAVAGYLEAHGMREAPESLRKAAEAAVRRIASSGAAGWDAPVEGGVVVSCSPAWLRKDSKRKLGWAYVRLPEAVRDAMKRVRDKIDFDDLGEDGKEGHPHVTAKYGLTIDNPSDVKDATRGNRGGRVRMGKTSIFEKEDGDVLKVSVTGHALHSLWKSLSELPNEDEFDEYRPHATLAYLKKGAGRKYRALDDLDGMEFTFDSFVFEDAHDVKTEIALDGKGAEASGPRIVRTAQFDEEDGAFEIGTHEIEPHPRAAERFRVETFDRLDDTWVRIDGAVGSDAEAASKEFDTVEEAEAAMRALADGVGLPVQLFRVVGTTTGPLSPGDPERFSVQTLSGTGWVNSNISAPTFIYFSSEEEARGAIRAFVDGGMGRAQGKSMSDFRVVSDRRGPLDNPPGQATPQEATEGFRVEYETNQGWMDYRELGTHRSELGARIALARDRSGQDSGDFRIVSTTRGPLPDDVPQDAVARFAATDGGRTAMTSAETDYLNGTALATVVTRFSSAMHEWFLSLEDDRARGEELWEGLVDDIPRPVMDHLNAVRPPRGSNPAVFFRVQEPTRGAIPAGTPEGELWQDVDGLPPYPTVDQAIENAARYFDDGETYRIVDQRGEVVLNDAARREFFVPEVLGDDGWRPIVQGAHFSDSSTAWIAAGSYASERGLPRRHVRVVNRDGQRQPYPAEWGVQADPLDIPVRPTAENVEWMERGRRYAWAYVERGTIADPSFTHGVFLGADSSARARLLHFENEHGESRWIPASHIRRIWADRTRFRVQVLNGGGDWEDHAVQPWFERRYPTAGAAQRAISRYVEAYRNSHRADPGVTMRVIDEEGHESPSPFGRFVVEVFQGLGAGWATVPWLTGRGGELGFSTRQAGEQALSDRLAANPETSDEPGNYRVVDRSLIRRTASAGGVGKRAQFDDDGSFEIAFHELGPDRKPGQRTWVFAVGPNGRNVYFNDKDEWDRTRNPPEKSGNDDELIDRVKWLTGTADDGAMGVFELDPGQIEKVRADPSFVEDGDFKAWCMNAFPHFRNVEELTLLRKSGDAWDSIGRFSTMDSLCRIVEDQVARGGDFFDYGASSSVTGGVQLFMIQKQVNGRWGHPRAGRRVVFDDYDAATAALGSPGEFPSDSGDYRIVGNCSDNPDNLRGRFVVQRRTSRGWHAPYWDGAVSFDDPRIAWRDVQSYLFDHPSASPGDFRMIDAQGGTASPAVLPIPPPDRYNLMRQDEDGEWMTFGHYGAADDARRRLAELRAGDPTNRYRVEPVFPEPRPEPRTERQSWAVARFVDDGPRWQIVSVFGTSEAANREVARLRLAEPETRFGVIHNVVEASASGMARTAQFDDDEEEFQISMHELEPPPPRPPIQKTPVRQVFMIEERASDTGEWSPISLSGETAPKWFSSVEDADAFLSGYINRLLDEDGADLDAADRNNYRIVEAYVDEETGRPVDMAPQREPIGEATQAGGAQGGARHMYMIQHEFDYGWDYFGDKSDDGREEPSEFHATEEAAREDLEEFLQESAANDMEYSRDEFRIVPCRFAIEAQEDRPGRPAEWGDGGWEDENGVRMTFPTPMEARAEIANFTAGSQRNRNPAAFRVVPIPLERIPGFAQARQDIRPPLLFASVTVDEPMAASIPQLRGREGAYVVFVVRRPYWDEHHALEPNEDEECVDAVMDGAIDAFPFDEPNVFVTRLNDVQRLRDDPRFEESQELDTFVEAYDLRFADDRSRLRQDRNGRCFIDDTPIVVNDRYAWTVHPRFAGEANRIGVAGGGIIGSGILREIDVERQALTFNISDNAIVDRRLNAWWIQGIRLLRSPTRGLGRVRRAQFEDDGSFEIAVHEMDPTPPPRREQPAKADSQATPGTDPDAPYRIERLGEAGGQAVVETVFEETPLGPGGRTNSFDHLADAKAALWSVLSCPNQDPSGYRIVNGRGEALPDAEWWAEVAGRMGYVVQYRKPTGEWDRIDPLGNPTYELASQAATRFVNDHPDVGGGDIRIVPTHVVRDDEDAPEAQADATWVYETEPIDTAMRSALGMPPGSLMVTFKRRSLAQRNAVGGRPDRELNATLSGLSVGNRVSGPGSNHMRAMTLTDLSRLQEDQRFADASARYYVEGNMAGHAGGEVWRRLEEPHMTSLDATLYAATQVASHGHLHDGRPQGIREYRVVSGSGEEFDTSGSFVVVDRTPSYPDEARFVVSREPSGRMAPLRRTFSSAEEAADAAVGWCIDNSYPVHAIEVVDMGAQRAIPLARLAAGRRAPGSGEDEIVAGGTTLRVGQAYAFVYAPGAADRRSALPGRAILAGIEPSAGGGATLVLQNFDEDEDEDIRVGSQWIAAASPLDVPEEQVDVVETDGSVAGAPAAWANNPYATRAGARAAINDRHDQTNDENAYAIVGHTSRTLLEVIRVPRWSMEGIIPATSITRAIAGRMSRILRSMGYASRGADDVLEALRGRPNGGRPMLDDGRLWHPDWVRAYEQAVTRRRASTRIAQIDDEGAFEIAVHETEPQERGTAAEPAGQAKAWPPLYDPDAEGIDEDAARKIFEGHGFALLDVRQPYQSDAHVAAFDIESMNLDGIAEPEELVAVKRVLQADGHATDVRIDSTGPSAIVTFDVPVFYVRRPFFGGSARPAAKTAQFEEDEYFDVSFLGEAAQEAHERDMIAGQEWFAIQYRTTYGWLVPKWDQPWAGGKTWGPTAYPTEDKARDAIRNYVSGNASNFNPPLTTNSFRVVSNKRGVIPVPRFRAYYANDDGRRMPFSGELAHQFGSEAEVREAIERHVKEHRTTARKARYVVVDESTGDDGAPVVDGSDGKPERFFVQHGKREKDYAFLAGGDGKPREFGSADEAFREATRIVARNAPPHKVRVISSHSGVVDPRPQVPGSGEPRLPDGQFQEPYAIEQWDAPSSSWTTISHRGYERADEAWAAAANISRTTNGPSPSGLRVRDSAGRILPRPPFFGEQDPPNVRNPWRIEYRMTGASPSSPWNHHASYATREEAQGVLDEIGDTLARVTTMDVRIVNVDSGQPRVVVQRTTPTPGAGSGGNYYPQALDPEAGGWVLLDGQSNATFATPEEAWSSARQWMNAGHMLPAPDASRIRVVGPDGRPVRRAPFWGSEAVPISECEQCGAFHELDFADDCRDNNHRFSDAEDASRRLGRPAVEVYPPEEEDPEEEGQDDRDVSPVALTLNIPYALTFTNDVDMRPTTATLRMVQGSLDGNSHVLTFENPRGNRFSIDWRNVSSCVSVMERLEYLRGEIDAERISQEEIAELQGLAEFIEPGDVTLLQWAGVPEEGQAEPQPPFFPQTNVQGQWRPIRRLVPGGARSDEFPTADEAWGTADEHARRNGLMPVMVRVVDSAGNDVPRPSQADESREGPTVAGVRLVRDEVYDVTYGPNNESIDGVFVGVDPPSAWLVFRSPPSSERTIAIDPNEVVSVRRDAPPRRNRRGRGLTVGQRERLIRGFAEWSGGTTPDRANREDVASYVQSSLPDDAPAGAAEWLLSIAGTGPQNDPATENTRPPPESFVNGQTYSWTSTTNANHPTHGSYIQRGVTGRGEPVLLFEDAQGDQFDVRWDAMTTVNIEGGQDAGALYLKFTETPEGMQAITAAQSILEDADSGVDQQQAVDSAMEHAERWYRDLHEGFAGSWEDDWGEVSEAFADEVRNAIALSR